MRRRIFFFAIAMLVFSAQFGAAQSSQDETTLTFTDSAPQAEAQASRNSVWLFVRMLVVLACTAGAIYALVWILKKSSAPKISGNPFLREVVSIPLSAGASAHILTVANRAFLVGSGEKSVNLIAEITDKDLIDGMVVYASQNGDAAKKDFGDFLATFIPALQKKGPQKAPTAADLLRQQREKLQKEESEE